MPRCRNCVCPIFRILPSEEASPRAKANLVRGVLTGQLPNETLLQDACKEVADLCVHCHMCRLECPANVDIPKLMLEAKAANVAECGLDRYDRFFSNLDSWSAWAQSSAQLLLSQALEQLGDLAVQLERRLRREQLLLKSK